jgi:hypothetical protein
MNKVEMHNFMQPNRHILALACGILGGAFPNTMSNIHPYLTGALVAGFTVKMIYGDYDQGYQWALSDLIFWVITLFEGFLGALLITSL